MFKFLKSKKGFTLVELMIVVVIMAILVAVAVPIYSAVTKNARIKTCAGNRREIVSQVNNYLMGSIDGSTHNVTSTETIYIVSDGAKGWFSTDVGGEEADEIELAGADKTALTGLFQTLPYCPSGDDATNKQVTYTIQVSASTVTSADADKTGVISVSCNAGTIAGEAHA